MEYVNLTAVQSTPITVTTKKIERASKTDKELDDFRNCLLTGQWHKFQVKEYYK